jgi:hypothetical protein
MKKVLIAIILAMVFVGCHKQPEVSSVVVTDISGKKYRLVSAEKKISDIMTKPEVWERIEPLDTNHWYSRTLSSVINTNEPAMFNSFPK